MTLDMATPAARRLFHEGTLALAELERNGLAVDADYLARADRAAADRVRALTAELQADDVWKLWKRSFGGRANLWSPEQLGVVLFDKMGLPSPGRTAKSGKHKTEKGLFDGVELPFVRKYIEAKEWAKARAVYFQGLSRSLADGRVHPFYHLHNIVTYRSSSSEPNVQNIPSRNPDIMTAIRQAFVPAPGCVLGEFDYGALEFKVACDFWLDEAMLAYGRDEASDIHRDQTAEVYGCTPDEVSKPMRSIGKNKFVFPILYGSYYVNCAKDLWAAISQFDLKLKDGTPVRQRLRSLGVTSLGPCEPRERPLPGTYEHFIKKAEDAFFAKFPTFATKKEEWWRLYLSRGWFPMMTGFVSRGIFSRNDLQNHPIQGPGFHCLLQAMVWLIGWLKKHKMKTKVVCEIHDCMITEGPESEFQDVAWAVEYFMVEKLARHWDWLAVPMTVVLDVVVEGSHWAAKRPYVKRNGVWEAKG
jgi:DNA polymerase-1